MSEKKSFVIYGDYQNMFCKLSDQDAGKLIKGLLEYFNDGVIPELPPAADMAFTVMQNQISRDAAKWQAVREKRRAAINKRWHGQDDTNDTNVFNSIQDDTNDTVNVNVNENVNVNVNDNVNVIDIKAKKPAKRFKPPTLDDVKAYCRERNNGVNAEKFIDHYTSNGWKVGRNSMKDWKAAVRTWERNGFHGQQTTSKIDESKTDLDHLF